MTKTTQHITIHDPNVIIGKNQTPDIKYGEICNPFDPREPARRLQSVAFAGSANPEQFYSEST